MTQKPYLFTDLDRTMIFSKRFLSDKIKLTPVEFKEGRIISYMTPQALALTKEYHQHIIPVTTRSLNEFRRVEPYQLCPWAIVGNGSLILHNNQPVQEWTELLSAQLKPSRHDYEVLIHWLNTQCTHLLEREATPREKFIFAKVQESFKAEIKNRLQEKLKEYPDWQFVLQSKKLYLMPTVVSKEKAIEYILEQLPDAHPIYFAGDGSLDINMINLSQTIPNAHSFTPENTDAHKAAQTPHLAVVSNQPDGAEEILQHVFLGDKNHAI